MPLSTVKLTLVGSAARDIEDLLRPLGIAPAVVPALSPDLFADGDAPDVVILDVRQSRGLPPAVAELTRKHPAMGVVVVAASLDPALMLEALNAGAKGFLGSPATVDQLTAAIARVAPGVRTEPGRLLAFVGAKGGVGTTTLAVNVATALSGLSKGGTLLVDLNARYGDAAACLGAEPRFTVQDALDNAQRLDVPYMRGLVVRTAADLDLLAAADRPAPGPVDLLRLRALLEFARRQYRYTVLDVPRTDAAMLDALDGVATIVVVVSQEVTAIKSAARLLETLRARYGADHVQVALGREDKQAELSPEDLQQTLRSPVRVFPSEYRKTLESLNRGRPLVLENHSRLSSELNRFVRELAGVPAKPKKDGGGGSRLPKWLGGGKS